MSSLTDEVQRAAMDFLKGKDNPFESLARPQRMDESFLDLHVPELLAGQRKLLLQIIDHYRVPEFTRAADLPQTRAVTILGDRGAGKTHLLQSLAYREDGKSQILVRPRYYNHGLPFEEYLLSQLVTTLLAEDEVFHSRPIEDIAGALAPRLLRQAICALGPTDRVFALSPGFWERVCLVLGGADRKNQLFEQLAKALQGARVDRDVPELIREHGLSPHQALGLLLGHVRRFEAGPDLLSGLRRALYEAMARSVLLGEREPLLRFLEGGYAEIGSPSTTRIEIVARLLHALTEACALVRQPIVIAFDNLESLFSPRNTFDGEVTRIFWNTLAQTIDHTRGLLILIFAEKGLFEKTVPFMDDFARPRVEQGVPIFGRGPVHLIDLQPPGPDETDALIYGRMQRWLRGFPRAAELPKSFPFSNGTTGGPAATQSLRNTLLRLRDQYSQLVYAQSAPAVEPVSVVNWESLLQSKWSELFTAAGPRMANSPVSHLRDMHAGLDVLLQNVMPLSLDGWNLEEVQATVRVGNNASYGVASLLRWRALDGAAEKNGACRKIGVGFLLGQKAGMPPDLRSKLEFFRPALGDELLILWPSPNDADNLVELLPAATRSEWDRSRAKKKTTLRRVEMNDLRTLLVLPDWFSAVQTLADQPPPTEVLHAFARDHFQSLVELIRPPEPVTPENDGEGE